MRDFFRCAVDDEVQVVGGAESGFQDCDTQGGKRALSGLFPGDRSGGSLRISITWGNVGFDDELVIVLDDEAQAGVAAGFVEAGWEGRAGDGRVEGAGRGSFGHGNSVR